MKFVIYGRLPSLNEYVRMCRSNKYIGANFKKKTESDIYWSIKQANLSKVTKYPCKLKITWYEPNLRRDMDNIVFATKFIQDALVKENILIDDSQKYVSKLEHDVKIDKENPRIEVEIIERS